MSNCVLCSKELKFSNTPTFGSGKLNDGGVVCIDCYKKINNANAKMAYKLKNYTLYQVQEALQEKLNEENSKNSKLDEIKEQIKNLNLSNASQFLGRKEIKELPFMIDFVKLLQPEIVIG